MKQIITTIFLMAPAWMFAHGTHDFFLGTSIAHYLTSPMHFIPLGALFAIITYFTFIRKKIALKA